MQDTLPSSHEAPTNLTLREYGEILRRRRAIILQTFVIVLVIGILVNLYTPLTYSTSARLLTEPPRFSINSFSSSDPLNELFAVNQQYSLATQVQMLQNPKLMKEAAEKSNIPSPPYITVRPVEGTQLIEATAEGEDPQAITTFLNKLFDIYIDGVNTKSTEKLQKALTLAKTKSREAAVQIADLQKQSNDFKHKYSLYEVNANKDEYLSRVRELSDQYQSALSDMKGLEGRMAATNAALSQQKATLLPFLSIQGDPQIQSIENKVVELEIARDALKEGSGFKNEMPQVKQLNVQIDKLKKREGELLRSYVARNAVPNPMFKTFHDQIQAQMIELTGIRARTTDVQRRLTDAKKRLANFPDWEHEWARIQGGLAKAQRDFEYFSNQENILNLRSQATGGGPQKYQDAVIPTRPIRPNREQNILFAGLLGIFFGLCLALLQELFDDRINGPEESERVLHLPSLGMIPLIEEEGLRLIKNTPNSNFSPLMESYRKLRTNINFAAVGRPVRSLVVTSSIPAEGKSTTVANLAMAMAMEKKRVIIVDADLRRPSLHRLFKIDSSPGLTDVLVGECTIDEVVHPTGFENVFVIPAGSPPPNPAELLGSAEMGRFFETLETICDVAIFDSPPTLMVADSVVLASRANGVLLVIAYGETKKANTRDALQLLNRANANVLGTILNRMEGSNSGYYYGKYYAPPVTDKARPTNGRNSGPEALPGSNTEQNSALSLTRPRDNRNEEEN